MESDGHIRRDPGRGFFLALASTLLTSSNFVTAKYALRGFNPETFSTVWTSAAAFYALLFVLAFGQGRQLAVPRRAAPKILVMGVAVGPGMILAWSGLHRLDPSFTSAVWRFAPVVAMLFGALFLRERLTIRELIPVGFMLFGGLLATAGRWQTVGIGTALSLLGCCCFALQRLMAKMCVSQVHPNVLAFYRVGIGAPIIAAWLLAVGKADFNVAPRYWVVTFLGAFLGPCTSFLLSFRAYKCWELARVSMVFTMEPLFVLPLAYVLLRRLPTTQGLMGGGVILLGAFWLAWSQLRGKPQG